MTETANDDDMPVEQWLAIRKAEALKIDPATAEVYWHWAQVMDPYGVIPNLPEEDQCVGRSYFARNRGSDVWVSFYDLPEETAEVLWNRLQPPLTIGGSKEALASLMKHAGTGKKVREAIQANMARDPEGNPFR